MTMSVRLSRLRSLSSTCSSSRSLQRLPVVGPTTLSPFCLVLSLEISATSSTVLVLEFLRRLPSYPLFLDSLFDMDYDYYHVCLEIII